MDEFRAQVPNAGRAYRCCGKCTPKPPISRVKRRRLKQQTQREVEQHTRTRVFGGVVRLDVRTSLVLDDRGDLRRGRQ